MIRLICVGLGGMGRSDWMSAAEVPEFKIIAGVDVMQEPAEIFQRETGAPVYQSLAEALAAQTADAAIIATPDAFHAPFAIKALEAGLDVICEKPMAENMEDAQRMHEAALRNDRMLMIHHQLRWQPAYCTARALIATGAIGTVRQIEFNLSVNSDVCLHGYRAKLPQLILQDLAVHHFDLIRYLSGQECVNIYARSWPSNEEAVQISSATSVYAILEMTGPVTACYSSKMRALMNLTGYMCEAVVSGSRGELEIQPDLLRLQTCQGFSSKCEPEEIIPHAPETDTWEAFAQAIITRNPTLTCSMDNLKSLQILFAAMRSAISGQAEPIDMLAAKEMLKTI